MSKQIKLPKALAALLSVTMLFSTVSSSALAISAEVNPQDNTSTDKDDNGSTDNIKTVREALVSADEWAKKDEQEAAAFLQQNDKGDYDVATYEDEKQDDQVSLTDKDMVIMAFNAKGDDVVQISATGSEDGAIAYLGDDSTPVELSKEEQLIDVTPYLNKDGILTIRGSEKPISVKEYKLTGDAKLALMSVANAQEQLGQKTDDDNQNAEEVAEEEPKDADPKDEKDSSNTDSKEDEKSEEKKDEKADSTDEDDSIREELKEDIPNEINNGNTRKNVEKITQKKLGISNEEAKEFIDEILSEKSLSLYGAGTGTGATKPSNIYGETPIPYSYGTGIIMGRPNVDSYIRCGSGIGVRSEEKDNHGDAINYPSTDWLKDRINGGSTESQKWGYAGDHQAYQDDWINNAYNDTSSIYYHWRWRRIKATSIANAKSSDSYIDFHDAASYVNNKGDLVPLDVRIYLAAPKNEYQAPQCIAFSGRPDSNNKTGVFAIGNLEVLAKTTMPRHYGGVYMELHFYKSGTLKGNSPEEVKGKGYISMNDMDQHEGYQLLSGFDEVYVTDDTAVRHYETFEHTAVDAAADKPYEKNPANDVKRTDIYLGNKDSNHDDGETYNGVTANWNAQTEDWASIMCLFNNSSKALYFFYDSESGKFMNFNSGTVKLNYHIVGSLPKGYTNSNKIVLKDGLTIGMAKYTSTKESDDNAAAALWKHKEVPGYRFTGWKTKEDLSGADHKGRLMTNDFDVYGAYEPMTGNVKVVKKVTDLSGKNTDLAGYVFTLTGKNVAGETVNLKGTTNANGTYTFKDVMVGTYTLKEVGTPTSPDKLPAYVDTKDVTRTVKITEDNTEEENFTVTENYENMPETGNIKITKTIETVDSLGVANEYDKTAEGAKHYNEKLSGFAFHLSGTSTSGEKINEYAVTDANGNAWFEHIPVGTDYTVKEVKASQVPDSAACKSKATQELVQYFVAKDTITGVKVQWWKYSTDGDKWGTGSEKDKLGERTTELQFDNKLKKWNFDGDLSKFDLQTQKTTEAANYAKFLTGDAKLEGAVYGLYDGSKKVAEATTDKNGKFSFKSSKGYYIVGDEWYVQEIKPSEGYNLDTTKYKVKACAEPGHDISLTDHEKEGFNNSPEMHTTTTVPLLNTAKKGEFKGGNSVNEDPIRQPVGIFKFKSNDTTKIDNLADAHFSIYLKRELDLFIPCTSYKTTEFAAGTEEFYTDFFEAVRNGTVTIADADTYNTQIKPNTIEKKDAENGDKVLFKAKNVGEIGVPIAVQATNGEVAEVGDIVTDKTGYGVSEAINYGEYVAFETTVPEEQLKNAEAIVFKVKGVDGKSSTAPDNSLTFSIIDNVLKLKLELVKKDSDTKQTVLKANTEYLIYEVKKDGSFGKLITQNNSTENNALGSKNNPWKTDETGAVVLLEDLSAESALYSGDYYIAEVGGPEGYYNEYADTGVPLNGYYFTVDNTLTYERRYYLTDGTITLDPNLDDSLYKKNGDVRIHDDIVPIEYENPETRGKVIIEKKGEVLKSFGNSGVKKFAAKLFGTNGDEDFTYEEANLDGATYQIIAAEDIMSQDNQGTKWASAGDVIATVTTGKDASTDNVAIDCSGIVTTAHDDLGRVELTLPLGKYTVKEIQAPPGYVLDDQEKSLVFAWDDQRNEFVFDSSGSADSNGVLTFVNPRVKGYAELLKTDSFDDDPMEGVKFGVYTVDPIYNFDGEQIVEADGLLGYVFTDKDGKATTKGVIDLPIAFEGSENTGKYYFLEAETPRGYEENTTKYEFTLAYVDQNTPEVSAEVEAKNNPIPPVPEIEKEVDKDTVQVRDCQDGKGDLVYTVTAENKEGIAKHAYITDKFDSRLIFKSATMVFKDYNGTETTYEFTEGEGNERGTFSVDENGMYTFNVGNMVYGDSVVMTINTRIRGNVSAGSLIENQAIYNAPNIDGDPIPSNTVETKVVGPILAIVKEQKLNDGERTKEKLRAQRGDILTYYVTISNKDNATGPAYDVTIEDPLPDAEKVEYVDGSASDDGVYDADNNKINWELGTLEVGESKTVEFKVKVITELPKTEWLNFAIGDASNADKCQDEVDDEEATYKLIVHYVDTEGNTLWKDSTMKGPADSDYDASSLIFEEIGADYKIVGTGTFGNYNTTDGIAEGSDPTTGVFDSDKEITVVYDKADYEEPEHKVTIHYVDIDGNPIRPDIVDISGTDPYDETDKVYPTIGNYEIVGTGTNGKYETTDGIDNAGDPITGPLDDDKEITIVYKLNDPTPSKHKLIVHYVDTNGNALAADYIYNGKGEYDVSDKIPGNIDQYEIVGTGEFGKYNTTDGITNDSDPISGTLDSDKEITVVYDTENDPHKPGEGQKTVIVHYVDEYGNILAADVVKVQDEGTDYDVTTSVLPNIGEYEIVGTGDFGNYSTTDGITNDSDPLSGTLDDNKVITIVYTKPFKLISNEVIAEVRDPVLDIVKYQSVNGGEFTTSDLGVDAGDHVVYKLVITNSKDAGDIAFNTVVTDEIPEGLELVDGTISDDGTVEDRLITWNLGDIEIGESREVTFEVTVPKTARNETYRNIAYTTCDNKPDPDDPIPSNPVVIKVGAPHIIPEKFQQINDGKKTKKLLIAKPGDVVTYYVKVSNPRVEGESNGAANNLVITDPVPGELSLVEDSISDGGTYKDGVITWNVDTLPVDESIEVTFQMTVPNVSEEKTYENVATVKEVDPENPDDPDKPGLETNKVVIKEYVPKLSIEKMQAVNSGDKTKKEITVTAGDVITYYVTMKNSKESKVDATDIEITDDIPEGLTLVDGTISDNGKLDGKTIKWNIDELKIGKSVTVTFKVKVPSIKGSKTYKNIAQFTSPYSKRDKNGDPIPEDSNEVVAKQLVLPAPKTGDNSKIALLIGAIAVAGVAIAGAATYLVKTRKRKI